MEAAVGDRMVVASNKVSGPVRDGEIVQVGPSGGGPYLVRWADSGQESLFFPGPDAHIEHSHHEQESDQSASGGAESGPGQQSRHVKSWRVDVYVYEGKDATTAQAVLHSEVAEPLAERGVARRNPNDPEVPEIGDEVAVARALHRLGDRLLGVAADDISTLEGHEVHLRP
jgi:Domain of unknown function (DUF1876)/Domain of unknown function (DUF1918)